MSVDLEVRIKLSPIIHQKWTEAAAARGMPLKWFIAATISGELIKTGELQLGPQSAPVDPPLVAAPEKPAPKPKSVPYTPYEPDEDEIAYVKEQLTKKEATFVPTKPQLDAQSVVDAWSDDDDDDYT